MTSSKTHRLRALLSLEIRRVTEDLAQYRDLLVQVWGAQRARAPLLDVTFVRWRTLGFGELMILEPEEVASVSAWYRELDGLRLYLQTTDDMPRALSQVYDRHLARLEALSKEALAWLGAAEAVRLEIDFGEE